MWRIAAFGAWVSGGAVVLLGTGTTGHRLLIFAGVALMLLAGGLRRRSVVAGVAAVSVALAYVLASAPRVRLPAIAIAGVAALLVAQDAIAWPSRRRVALAAQIAGLVAALRVAVGLGAFWADPPTNDRSASAVVHWVLERLIRGDVGRTHPSSFVHGVNVGLNAVTAIAALVVLELLLPSRHDELNTDSEVESRVRALCGSPDADSLAPFSGRKDKNFVFSPDGAAIIGYRVVLGVCIAGPGPVGASASHADALAAWIRRCDENGWRPAMIGASATTRALAAELGMRGVHIGDEALVSVASFHLDQPSMRNVRQAVKRTHNSGVSVTVQREDALDDAQRAELSRMVEEWRRGHGEVGFAMTMDHLLDGEYPAAIVVIAYQNDRPVGFQRYFLTRAGSILSLDVMPRLRNAPNGTNERLITEALAWGSANGVDELSLNFAAFRTLFEAKDSPITRTAAWIVHRLDRFINVESLYRFNAKFRPTWIPRHVLYRSFVDLPAVLAASLRVEFGSRRPDRAEHDAAPDWVVTANNLR